MQYVIDQNEVVHAVRADHTHVRALCCGQAGQWRALREFPQDGALCEFCALYMLPEVTCEGFHLRTVARLCRSLESPIDNGLAAIVWRLSTTSFLDSSLAADFLRACGYKPFQGFPLQRLKSPNLEFSKKA